MSQLLAVETHVISVPVEIHGGLVSANGVGFSAAIHAVMETEVHFLKKAMLLINYEAPEGSKRHQRLWNGGSGWGTIKLYDKKNESLELVDEVEATHIGCEYGEYDHEEQY